MDDELLLHADDEREDHKYIARIEINEGKQKYRYFYTKEAYQAYLNGLKAQKETKNKQSNFLDRFKSLFSKKLSETKNFTKKVEIGKKNLNTLLKKVDKKITIKKVSTKKFTKMEIKPKKLANGKVDIVKQGRDVLNKFLSKAEKTSEKVKKEITEKVKEIKKDVKKNIPENFSKNKIVAGKKVKPIKLSGIIETISEGKKAAEKVINKITTKAVGDISPKTLKTAVYIADTLTNGIVKSTFKLMTNSGIYDEDYWEEVDDDDWDPYINRTNYESPFLDEQDEQADYFERLRHQENEPDFMKDVPDIPDDVIFSKFEDQEKINEEYDPYDPSRSQNCANCSVAYELRRRGYDVEAKIREDEYSYNGRGDRVYDYFEDAVQYGIDGDGNTIVMNEKYLKKLWDEGYYYSTTAKLYNAKDNYDFLTTDHSYTAESIEQGILKNSPPGSRGFIDVTWKNGGAHSIVYEVDSKGSVIIRDSQIWDEYALDELAKEVSVITVTRTDNLELKKDILDAVQPNEDKKRKYFVEGEWAYYY